MKKVNIIKCSLLLGLLGVSIAQTEQPAPRPRTTTMPGIKDPSLAPKGPILKSAPGAGRALPTPTPTASTSVTVTHLCNDKIGLTSSPINAPAKPASDPEKSCVAVNPAVTFLPDDILRPIYAKKIAIQTRTQALINELSDYPDTVLDIIANSYNTEGKLLQPIDFVNLLKKASLTAQKISFYFDLCYQIYYKGALNTNPNTSSVAYKKMLLAKQDQVKNIDGDIKRIDQFTATLEQELSQKNIARLGSKTSERKGQKKQAAKGSSLMESKQEQNLGYQSEQSASKQGMEHRFGTGGKGVGVHSGTGEEEETTQSEETQDVKIKTLTPAIIRSLAQDYVAIFGKEDLSTTNFEALSVAQLGDILAKKRLALEQAQIDAQTDLRIFSDPNLRDFWAKLDQVLKKEAEGFTPIDVFYRTTASYTTSFKIMDKLAYMKRNVTDPQSKKEISGVMLFKEGSKTSAQEPLVDEIAIVFSGSNSYEDWKHNLDFFKQEGLAAHNIASNMRAHRGIINSLKESLDEAGSKVKNWIEKYKAKRGKSPTRPTLRITVAGHSLGGALALLTGVFIKQNVAELLKPVADLKVVVITFGAPPIFNQRSAEKVKDLFKDDDILRFWNIGDPVANMSILVKDSRKMRSPIATLLGYYHVGTSIPLFDNDKMGNRMEIFNPWKSHLSNRYANLLYGNWQEVGNEKMQALQKIMQQRNVIQDQKLIEQIDQLISFIEDSPEASNTVKGLTFATLKNIIETSQKKSDIPLESTVEHMRDLQEQRYEQGKVDPLKFEKVDLTKETKALPYIHKLEGKAINITLDRSTSCQLKSLAKQFKFAPSSFTPVGQAEISCACCIVKNTFVSYGGGTIFHRFKDFVSKKDTKTPTSIYQYCEAEQHCSDPEVKKKLFPQSSDLIYSFGKLMQKLGLQSQWMSKKVK